MVVMYTLQRGDDGNLHGPISKKIWATFAGRKAAAGWARAAATPRGFGPGFGPHTTQTVQIVLDGAKGLKQNLEPLFPHALFTLDVCHVVEKCGTWAIASTPKGAKNSKRRWRSGSNWSTPAEPRN